MAIFFHSLAETFSASPETNNESTGNTWWMASLCASVATGRVRLTGILNSGIEAKLEAAFLSEPKRGPRPWIAPTPRPTLYPSARSATAPSSCPWTLASPAAAIAALGQETIDALNELIAELAAHDGLIARLDRLICPKLGLLPCKLIKILRAIEGAEPEGWHVRGGEELLGLGF